MNRVFSINRRRQVLGLAPRKEQFPEPKIHEGSIGTAAALAVSFRPQPEPTPYGDQSGRDKLFDPVSWRTRGSRGSPGRSWRIHEPPFHRANWPCRSEAAILAKLRNKEGKSARPWGRCATKIEPVVPRCYKWVYPIEAVEVTAAGRHRRVGKLILLQKSRVATLL